MNPAEFLFALDVFFTRFDLLILPVFSHLPLAEAALLLWD